MWPYGSSSAGGERTRNVQAELTLLTRYYVLVIPGEGHGIYDNRTKFSNDLGR